MSKRLSRRQNLLHLVSDLILSIEDEYETRGNESYLANEARTAPASKKRKAEAAKSESGDEGEVSEKKVCGTDSSKSDDPASDQQDQSIASRVLKVLDYYRRNQNARPAHRFITHVREMPAGMDIIMYNYEKYYRVSTLWDFPNKYTRRPAGTSWTAFYRNLNLDRIAKEEKRAAKAARRRARRLARDSPSGDESDHQDINSARFRVPPARVSPTFWANRHMYQK